MKFSFENITLKRGGCLIVEDLSLQIKQGQTLLLTGVNGSGKSSLLLYLAGLLEGEGSVVGTEDFFEKTLLIENALPLKREMTSWDNMKMWFDIWGDGLCRRKSDFEAVLKRLEIEDFIDIPVKNMSSGQQKKLWLSQLWFRSKPVWLLDEPSTNLDEKTLELLSGMIRLHTDAGGVVVCAEHQRGWADFNKEICLDRIEKKERKAKK